VCFHLFNCRIPCLSNYFCRVSFQHSFILIRHSSIFNMATAIWLHNKLVGLLDTVTALSRYGILLAVLLIPPYSENGFLLIQ
jgi:hypothetical protein